MKNLKLASYAEKSSIFFIGGNIIVENVDKFSVQRKFNGGRR